MRGMGYITLFWLNALGFMVVVYEVFIFGGTNENSGVAFLNSFLNLSFLAALIALSFFVITSKPAFRQRWTYLFLAIPIASLVAAFLIWMQHDAL